MGGHSSAGASWWVPCVWCDIVPPLLRLGPLSSILVPGPSGRRPTGTARRAAPGPGPGPAAWSGWRVRRARGTVDGGPLCTAVRGEAMSSKRRRKKKARARRGANHGRRPQC
ncbi:hypothetical protein GCM10009759_26310 [Kitasatospora saccharophila]|uniref:Secreted protein n=1 Tax=Kitasatospora saccharophila TaxID=407973 RepID=A0ABN2WPX2_9ACTN